MYIYIYRNKLGIACVFGLIVCLTVSVFAKSDRNEPKYQVGIVVLAMDGEERFDDSYVIHLQKAESKRIKHWLNCPVKSVPEDGGDACGYYGPNLPKNPKGESPDPKDYEFHGQIWHQVLTDGFPLKVNLKYVRKNQVKELIEVEVDGLVTFNNLDDMSIIRSACGKYIMIAKLFKPRRPQRDF